MPSMGSGAAEGLQEVLSRLFLQAQAKQQQRQQAEQMALQQARLSEDARQADMGQELGRGNLNLRGQEFSRQMGRDVVEDTRYQEAAPARAANLRMSTAQAGEMERKPLAEQQEREFITGRDATLHGYRSSEIGQRSADARAGDWQLVTHTNPTTNETATFRINKLTGQSERVSTPEGFQPGGAKQTRLSAGQQDDLSTMATVSDMATAAVKLGQEIGWKGVGGMMAGTRGQFMMKQFGSGDPREEVLRNTISNIQGTIAKLRGGTSFTTNEQKLLDSYTPTKDEDAKSIQAKLSGLQDFIALKRKNTMQFAGGPQAAAPNGASPAKNNDPLGIR